MEAITTFERDCSKFPAQYTPEWFARVDSVGGSEMHDLMEHSLVLAARKICRLITQTISHSAGAPSTSSANAREPSNAIPTMLNPLTAPPFSCTGAAELVVSREPKKKGPTSTADEFAILEVVPTAKSPSPPADLLDSPRSSCNGIFGLSGDIKVVSMSGNVAMGWGTLFEPVLCNYLAQRLNIPILCRSVSFFKDPFRFSPDGVLCDANSAAVLLEMKDPFVRIWQGWDVAQNDQLVPPHNAHPNPNAVPPHYIPQLQLGLHLIEFLAYALYVEAAYRRANSYGNACAIGLQRMRELRNASVLDTGIIGFYHAFGTGDLETVYNFSTIKNDLLLCHILTHQREPTDGGVFVPLYFREPSLDATQAREELPTSMSTTVMVAQQVFKSPEELPLAYNGLPLFGYMPWNLLGIHSVRVERDPSFMTATMLKNAQFVSNYIHALLQATYEQRMAALQQLYEIALLAGSGQADDIGKMIKDMAAMTAQAPKKIV